MPSPSFTFDPIAHIYYLDGVEIPGVSDALEEGGLKHSYGGFQEAQWRGLHVHNACELLDLGDLDWNSVYPQWLGYVKSWERFKEEYGFINELVEFQTYHPAYHYGGTIDRRGRCSGITLDYNHLTPGRRVLADLKTGAPEDWHRFQLAGYQALRFEDWKDDLRLGIYLQEDGSCAKYVKYEQSEDLRLFLAALTITHYKRSQR